MLGCLFSVGKWNTVVFKGSRHEVSSSNVGF